jgi:large subunit ribosomal protein L23
MHPYDVLRRPIITEKGTYLQAQNKYVFEVAKGTNKIQIKEAVERAFNVKVLAR